MKLLSVLLNVALLLIVVGMAIDDGWPRRLSQQAAALVFFAAPICSILALWRLQKRTSGESWFRLFIERKRLEEKAKLRELRARDSET